MNMNVNTKINGIKQMTLTVLYIQGKERERERERETKNTHFIYPGTRRFKSLDVIIQKFFFCSY